MEKHPFAVRISYETQRTDNIPNENQSGERHGEDNIDDEELIYAFLEEPT